MEAGEGEDPFVVAQVAPGVEAGRVEYEPAEGACGPVVPGGDVLDGAGGDGTGEPADIAVRRSLYAGFFAYASTISSVSG
ncbi:hypothetical protein EDD95_1089 [Streptomyces sp. CEV 2-1]|uniref:hypothetical protein n=1 Tax=Streptomyces sp. CEV 2-1 TaxID=2485153 RepID=UPI000F469985|nr:hypothetical protein [Streptomyces sp. CEV 2-1]ROQ81515.1 hypothetical protein EDD95_1089 [Streptomyces sp. CEV 2-1]